MPLLLKSLLTPSFSTLWSCGSTAKIMAWKDKNSSKLK